MKTKRKYKMTLIDKEPDNKRKIEAKNPSKCPVYPKIRKTSKILMTIKYSKMTQKFYWKIKKKTLSVK